jgi:WD40 repeat protein
VAVWDAWSGEALLTFEGHKDRITGVAFRPDGRQFATAAMDKTVNVWDARSGKLLHTLTGPRSLMEAVAYSPNGRRLAAGAADGSLLIWDADTGVETFRSRPVDWARWLGFDPGGNRLAVGGTHGEIVVLVQSQVGFCVSGSSG